MMIERESLRMLDDALDVLAQGFEDLPEYAPAVDLSAMRPMLLEAARRMQDNYPYPHPLYAGQMLKPPHPMARLAYMLAIWMNPNNHALDGGRASSAMEKEAVAEIAAMFGWQTHLGHICGGGTMANLEALWVAREVTGGRKVLASQQSHYTHPRLCAMLRIPFEAVPVDRQARIDPNALEDLLKRGDVGTVVAAVGSTATASCDPLPEIHDLRERYGFRLHVDAAYGGYYTLVDTLRPETRRVYDRITEADSIVVDPHKHGMQPYGCGCVLFRDPSVGTVYKHESPYTYFSSDELHLGEISLECSRPGASAVALWATQKLMPLVRGGGLARGLGRCRSAACALFERLQSDPRFMTALAPELDIVIWAVRAGTATEVSRLSRALFDTAAEENLHLAVAGLPAGLFRDAWPIEWDTETVSCMRSCMMKPDHADWIDRIWAILDRATDRVLAS
jgi:tyrosine decarboxylase / aspartate 1-decarboxylase